ncbi:DNA repair exonuclease [Paenibacillus hemerocallicola]|uniref:DNA repair exonuclease n=1 Tax=Paenibacillus hemerocallicola TaxID=1172614 RepID=A0A5C4T948_9BACL|nr:DNA repair exonuclease [Paenibacillus hemerocallicola]TNJ65266.1 DNA repair exonuclease [Paenibacillus hemerocallicola]
MKAFRFIHAADLHLDSPFKGLSALPPSVRDPLRESTFDALQRLVGIAIDERADFVLIAGDVYDSADRSLRAQLRFQRAVETLAERGIPVYAVHGNHDPDDGRKAKLRWPDSVRFFSSAEAECFPASDPLRGDLAYIHGWSYPTASVTENPLSRYGSPRTGGYNIGLLHANADGDPGHDNYAPCSVKELIRTGMDYWALGHIHSRRVLNDRPPIVYPGNLQGRSVRETGAKGCYVVDVAESGRTSLSFRAADAVRWFAADISIEGMTSEQELRDRLEERMRECEEEAGGRPSIVRFRLEGRGPLHRALRRHGPVRELTEELREAQRRRAEGEDGAPFVWIESVQVRSGSELDMRLAAGRSGFLGDLMQLSEELAGDDVKLQAFCEEALAPLLAHPKAGALMAGLLGEERADWLKAAEIMAISLVAEEEGWDE